MKHLKKLLSALLVMVLLSGLPVYAAETAETPDAAADYAIIQKTDFVFQWQGPIKRTHTLTAEYEPMSGVNSGISAPDPNNLFQKGMIWQCQEFPNVRLVGDEVLQHAQIVALFGPDVNINGATFHFLSVPKDSDPVDPPAPPEVKDEITVQFLQRGFFGRLRVKTVVLQEGGPDQKAPRISGLFARNMVWKSDDGTVVLKPGDRFTYEQMKTLANADGVVHFSAGKRQ